MARTTPLSFDSTSAGTASVRAGVLLTRLTTHGRLRQLQLLVAIEDTGSIAQAAAAMTMSQSAATQALAELERITGSVLFERHARGVRATAAGHALMSMARGTMTALGNASQALASLQLGATASLRLGAIPAAAQALMSRLMGDFYTSHPDIHLELLEHSGTELLPMLFAGSLDAVFCRAPPHLPAGFTFEPLLEDRGVIMAGTGHPLAGQKALPLSALTQARWVLPETAIQLRAVFESVILTALPHAIWFPVATRSLPILEGFLQQPQAVSLVPQSMCAAILASGRVCQLDVDLAAPMAPLGVAYAQSGKAVLLEQLIQQARQIRGDGRSTKL